MVLAAWANFVTDKPIRIVYNELGQKVRKKIETTGLFINATTECINLYFTKYGKIRINFKVPVEYIETATELTPRLASVSGGGLNNIAAAGTPDRPARTNTAVIAAIRDILSVYEDRLKDMEQTVGGKAGLVDIKSLLDSMSSRLDQTVKDHREWCVSKFTETDRRSLAANLLLQKSIAELTDKLSANSATFVTALARYDNDNANMQTSHQRIPRIETMLANMSDRINRIIQRMTPRT